MAEFRVTFGQRYLREPHEMEWVHPDGWLTVEAKDEETARDFLFNWMGLHWSFIYPAETFEPELFPLGELHRIEVSREGEIHE